MKNSSENNVAIKMRMHISRVLERFSFKQIARKRCIRIIHKNANKSQMYFILVTSVWIIRRRPRCASNDVPTRRLSKLALIIFQTIRKKKTSINRPSLHLLPLFQFIHHWQRFCNFNQTCSTRALPVSSSNRSTLVAST